VEVSIDKTHLRFRLCRKVFCCTSANSCRTRGMIDGAENHHAWGLAARQQKYPLNQLHLFFMNGRIDVNRRTLNVKRRTPWWCCFQRHADRLEKVRLFFGAEQNLKILAHAA
jgi:hypothetical protein